MAEENKFDHGAPVTPRESIATLCAALAEIQASLNEGDAESAQMALDEARRRLRILGVAYWHHFRSDAPAWPCRCPWCMTDGEFDEFWQRTRANNEFFMQWADGVRAKQAESPAESPG